MARFRATIQGQRGAASRLGGTKSGIRANVDGWNGGIRVEAHGGPEADAFSLFMTGGSNGRGGSVYLGRVVTIKGEPWWDPAPVASTTDKVLVPR